MGKKLKIIMEIEDENGETLIRQTRERDVPYIEEIEREGFRAAYHEIETAVLEIRKETSDEIVSEYLEMVSEKKQKGSRP